MNREEWISKSGRKRPEKSWELNLCKEQEKRAQRQNGEMFLPTSLFQTQRAKENKHTRRATMQVNNQTTACTPGGEETEAGESDCGGEGRRGKNRRKEGGRERDKAFS